MLVRRILHAFCRSGSHFTTCLELTRFRCSTITVPTILPMFYGPSSKLASYGTHCTRFQGKHACCFAALRRLPCSYACNTSSGLATTQYISFPGSGSCPRRDRRAVVSRMIVTVLCPFWSAKHVGQSANDTHGASYGGTASSGDLRNIPRNACTTVRSCVIGWTSEGGFDHCARTLAFVVVVRCKACSNWRHCADCTAPVRITFSFFHCRLF